MKPICVPCQRFYRPERNGTFFIEGMPTGNAEPGTSEPEKWKPYKLWCGDLWECRGCGHQIIVGAGHAPIAEHYQEKFADDLRAYDAKLQVNDC